MCTEITIELQQVWSFLLIVDLSASARHFLGKRLFLFRPFGTYKPRFIGLPACTCNCSSNYYQSTNTPVSPIRWIKLNSIAIFVFLFGEDKGWEGGFKNLQIRPEDLILGMLHKTGGDTTVTHSGLWKAPYCAHNRIFHLPPELPFYALRFYWT